MKTCISGVILFDETLRQTSSSGISIPELIKKNGSIPGIKVDKGAKLLAGSDNEKVTEGLDGLRERMEEYYKLANATNAVNVDFSGGANGGVADGKVIKVAGIELVPTPHFVASNITTAQPDAGQAASLTAKPQAVNLTNFVALVCHPSAAGTVKLMDLAVESEYDIRRQGTLMVSKYAMGHGVLRPEAAARYPFTYAVSDPGGVAGIWVLSDQIFVLGIAIGDGIASANGAFLVPLKLESSAIPDLLAV